MKSILDDYRIIRAILAEFIFDLTFLDNFELKTECDNWKRKSKIEYGKWVLIPDRTNFICYVKEQ